MNSLILNRDFTHPADGWYQIEAKGDHPNRAAGVVQVIDDEAAQSIVNRFNSAAAARTLRHGAEMLIDHEHFSDQPDQETRAYGWLQQLQNRADGIYGQIRWTATGKPAVDGGDYRFFSTEYAPDDLKILNDGKTPRRVRPLRLDGLTLTNMNNNRGQKPITNRGSNYPALPADGKCPDCGDKLVKDTDGAGDMMCPGCKKHFADVSASAAGNQKTNNRTNTMKSIAEKLGLAAEASESSILDAVVKLQNRVTTLTPFETENTTLKNRLTDMESEQCDSLMSEHGIKADDAAKRDKLRPVLLALKNREDRLAFLKDCVTVEKPAETAQQRQLRNRDTRQPDKSGAAGATEQELAQKAEVEIQDYKIRNRCTYGEARNAVRSAKPELFGLK